MGEPDVWSDRERSRELGRALAEHKRWLEEWRALQQQMEDLTTLAELAREEDGDESVVDEVRQQVRVLEKRLEQRRIESLMSGEDDPRDAFLEIHAGAGGTDSQDWAQMLLRMYSKWADRMGFSHEVIDLEPGQEAGIKSASLDIRGSYAYGSLRVESGVHRLVRLSPFDQAHRRHTSFASVFAYAQVDEIPEIEIVDSDLRVDTFRASGAGGQHVNKTDSAVRITHLPTGITVQCQSERSQHRNRDNAMKILRARLYDNWKREQAEKRQAVEDEKLEIAWSSQIRSYVQHPYSLVKDHRTDVETGNVQAVMDGEIDDFIAAALKKRND
jgi:peptide chain release factor 2